MFSDACALCLIRLSNKAVAKVVLLSIYFKQIAVYFRKNVQFLRKSLLIMIFLFISSFDKEECKKCFLCCLWSFLLLC